MREFVNNNGEVFFFKISLLVAMRETISMKMKWIKPQMQQLRDFYDYLMDDADM